MNWIRVASRVSQDAKIWRLAELAGCDRHKAVGHCIDLWGAMTEQAQDGALGDVPDAVLEAWAQWDGRRGRFAAAVRATLLDERGVVAAWERYQGAAIREHAANRLRAEARRRAAREAGSPPDSTPDGTPYRTPDGTGDATRTVRRYETKTKTSTKEQQQKTDDDDARTEVRARLPEAFRGDLDDLLARTAPRSRPAWIRTLGELLAPGADRPGTAPAVVGRALREFNARDAAGLRLFAGYVGRLERPPAPRPHPNQPAGQPRLGPGAPSGAATADAARRVAHGLHVIAGGGAA